MPSLPVQSVRAAAADRDVLQAVATLLRQGKGDDLRRLIRSADERPVGPFRNEESAIAFLRDRIVVTLRPKMVWLFGSRARGEARPDSDFDVLIVLPDGLPAAAYGHRAVAAPLVACGLAYDAVPCSLSDFFSDRILPGSLVNRAVTEGKRLYQSPDLRRLEAP